MHPFTGEAASVIGNAIGHLSADDGFAMASHVALSALMAVFPFLIFVAALAGFFGEADLASRVASLLFETWPEDVAGPIATDVRNVLTRQQSGLLTISVLVTIFLASNGVEAVRTALNRAYRVVDKRNFILPQAAEHRLRHRRCDRQSRRGVSRRSRAAAVQLAGAAFSGDPALCDHLRSRSASRSPA